MTVQILGFDLPSFKWEEVVGLLSFTVRHIFEFWRDTDGS